jgi:hypothetical protein
MAPAGSQPCPRTRMVPENHLAGITSSTPILALPRSTDSLSRNLATQWRPQATHFRGAQTSEGRSACAPSRTCSAWPFPGGRYPCNTTKACPPTSRSAQDAPSAGESPQGNPHRLPTGAEKAGSSLCTEVPSLLAQAQKTHKRFTQRVYYLSLQQPH